MAEFSVSIDFKRLSIAGRMQLVGEIWDSIVDENAVLPLTTEQRDELDRRLEAIEQSPNAGTSWETIKRRLLETSNAISPGREENSRANES
jgi:putative addiction module component (TIGR02574 family)